MGEEVERVKRLSAAEERIRIKKLLEEPKALKKVCKPMLYEIESCEKHREGANGYTLHIEHLAVSRGDTLALTGESGCGKSTALDLLGLVLQPDSATTFTLTSEGTRYDIPDLFARKKFDLLADIRRKTIGYVLQTGELLPYLTVLENMILPATMVGIEPEAAKEEAHAVATQLGIAHKLSASPQTLSVGERQRVAIVRALVPKPAIILADEPTAALDPIHAGKVMDAFLEAVRMRATTLLLVTHNVSWVLESSLREIRFSLEQHDEGITAHVSDRS